MAEMPSDEPRRDFPVPLRVQVRHADGSESVEYAVNVSPRGFCLHCVREVAEGGEIRLRASLPPGGPEIEGRARVVWIAQRPATEDGPRFFELGVELVDLDPETEQRLDAYARQPIDRRR